MGTLLWDPAAPLPAVDDTPYLDVVTHVLVHRAVAGEYQFLHGPAICLHRGTLFCSWANSPVNENSEDEVLRGRRSADGGFTWSPVEVIAPDLPGIERHSHGAFLVHGDRLWAFAARYGLGDVPPFPGLVMETYVLNEAASTWDCQGVAATDFWPLEEPRRLSDGRWVMGGVNSRSYPVVALSRGDDLAHWDTVAIPTDPLVPLMYAEATVIADGTQLTAIIRNLSEPLALVAESLDAGRTWGRAAPSNLPMVPAKPYAGRLSTGQRYLIFNPPAEEHKRHTLTIAVSRPGERLLSRIWRIRHGPPPQPRFTGRAKGRQWAYPYACEHAGKLYIVYSVSKENCELSIVPLAALAAE